MTSSVIKVLEYIPRGLMGAGPIYEDLAKCAVQPGETMRWNPNYSVRCLSQFEPAPSQSLELSSDFKGAWLREHKRANALRDLVFWPNLTEFFNDYQRMAERVKQLEAMLKQEDSNEPNPD